MQRDSLSPFHFCLADLTSYFLSILLFSVHSCFYKKKTFKALNGLLCADVPLRNYSLTHSVWLWVIALILSRKLRRPGFFNLFSEVEPSAAILVAHRTHLGGELLRPEAKLANVADSV